MHGPSAVAEHLGNVHHVNAENMFQCLNKDVYWYVEGPVSDKITLSLSSGGVAAIVVVVVLLAVILVVVAVCLRRYRTVKVRMMMVLMQRYSSVVYAVIMSLRPSVCRPSVTSQNVPKRLNIGSHKQRLSPI